MLKKTVKYVDYDGREREDDLYFNLNKAEITEMQMSTQGGFAEYIQKIVKAQDEATLIALFKDLILKAYGEKSADGKHFKKSEELRDEFMSSAAFPELFMELATDADSASKFINGIIPADLAAEAAKEAAKSGLLPVS